MKDLKSARGSRAVGEVRRLSCPNASVADSSHNNATASLNERHTPMVGPASELAPDIRPVFPPRPYKVKH